MKAATIPNQEAEDTEPAPRDTVHWHSLARVYAYTRGHARVRNWAFILTAVRSLQKPALAWVMAAVINGPIAHGSIPGLLAGTGGFLALILFTEVTFHYRQRLSLELGESLVHDLRNDVFAHLQRMPMSFYSRTKLGSILSRMISDIEATRRGVQNIFFFSLLLLGQMLGSAALMIAYDWKLFCVLLVLGPFILWINAYYHPRLSRDSHQAAESQSRLTANLAEAVRGIRVIQGYTRQKHGEKTYRQLVDALAADNVTLAERSSIYVPLLDFTSQVFMALLLIVAAYLTLVRHQEMSAGSMIAYFFLPGLLFQSLQQFGNIYTQAISSMAGAERLFRLLDVKPDFEDAADVVDLPDPRIQANANPSALAPTVRFNDVSFAYKPGRPVLQGISFLAKPGETVALVGHTGSGKTSIINLLAKFYLPTEGEISIDGWDLQRLRSDSIRRQMGMVLQTNFLFTGTIIENIRLARPDATDEEVHAAARELDCYDVIQNLPHGFDTPVGEGGTSLSLGQRQLICFTRALIADPRILILDEATSSVDPITESRLQFALARLLKGRTSFVVAHRLSTIANADQILVLDQGRIIERGVHQELLAAGGAYATLYARFAQAGAA